MINIIFFRIDFQYFKKLQNCLVGLAVLIGCPGVSAGAYDDFFKAVELDQTSAVQSLLARGFDPNTPNPKGTPALLQALQVQSFRVAELLLSHPQTRIEVRNSGGESALMLAALRGQEALVVELVARGAQVNHRGWTALHYAATGGHARVAAFLIGAHADVNAESPNGSTPLMMAAMYGNAATVKFLLESGADPEVRNDQGLSAEDFAVRAGRDEAVRLIRQVRGR